MSDQGVGSNVEATAIEAKLEKTHILSEAAPRIPRLPKPNYAKIHSCPLPLDIFPLPTFIPHNPLSLFSILSALVSEFFSTTSMQVKQKSYPTYFSPTTRSVHLTDPAHVRALWEMGFFGKGSLSRSEPTWLRRGKEKKRLAQQGGVGTSSAEQATAKRREERRIFKLERARAEREAIEKQLRHEGKLGNGTIAGETTKMNDQNTVTSMEITNKGTKVMTKGTIEDVDNAAIVSKSVNKSCVEVSEKEKEKEKEMGKDTNLVDQEHLQLSLHEAFFLVYALGSLEVSLSPEFDYLAKIPPAPLHASELLQMFTVYSIFPAIRPSQIRPDNHFLTSYVVYHHYRSLGWVVRPGTKFAADWLLYNRGPVFSHAEFAVMIMLEYPDEWNRQWGHSIDTNAGDEEYMDEQKVQQKDWWSLHGFNRVQSQVRKTLLICYVEVPLGLGTNWHGEVDVGSILKRYKVRDFVTKRWLANRSRD